MLDALLAIASDPTAWPLWAIFLFSAAAYPVGFMLGSSCSPCCSRIAPCSECTEGELPDTVTVTLDNFPDQTRGPDLITLSFTSCFGFGVAGRVMEPGGDPDEDAGPISELLLTNKGSGYAKLGRVEPTVTASGGSGSGATMAVTLAQEQDNCNLDYWKVSSVSVSGGSGYADGDEVSFAVEDGDTAEQQAAATIRTTRSEPTLSASAPGGSGATFEIAYTENAGPPATWSISKISVTNGGTGYSGGSPLAISLGTDDVAEFEAEAYIRTSRTEPTLSATVLGSGSGENLAVNLASGGEDEYGPTWTVSSIDIIDGGAGFSEWDEVLVLVTDGQASLFSWFAAYVTAVDANGAITEITIFDGGAYYKEGGVVESVGLWGGGSYYKDDGVPVSVDVSFGGRYYREDASAEPYVAEITVEISQQGPSDGSGAVIRAVVEDDTASEDFGKVVSLEIDNAGDNYLAWKWVATACCGHQLNGIPIVLKRNLSAFGSLGIFDAACVYSHEICGGWTSFTEPNGVTRRSTGVIRIVVAYRGSALPPVVAVQGSRGSSDSQPPSCNMFATSDDLIANCDEFSFTATSTSGQWAGGNSQGGVTATVEPGGEYDADFRGKHGSTGVSYTRCTQCCQGADDIPAEIEVEVADRGYYGGDLSGVYVLPASGLFGNPWFVRWGMSMPLNELATVRFNIQIYIFPGFCEAQDEGCDNCIKACELQASAFMSFHPATWFAPSDEDMRYCGLSYENIPFDEYIARFCEAFCYPTPLCYPPPGLTFTSFQPLGSENFSQTGCPNCCAPNSEPTFQDGDPFEGPYTGPPQPDHLNTFTLTML